MYSFSKIVYFAVGNKSQKICYTTHLSSLSQSCCWILAIWLHTKSWIAQMFMIIHLSSSLEGDMKICSTQTIHVTLGRHKFSGLNKSSTLPINWANVYYTKSWSTKFYGAKLWTLRHDVWRETWRFVSRTRDFSGPIIFLYLSYQLCEV